MYCGEIHWKSLGRGRLLPTPSEKICFTSNQFRLMSRATSSQLAELPTPKVTSANAPIFHNDIVPKTTTITAHMDFFIGSVPDREALAGAGYAQLLQILDQARSSR